MSKEKLKSLRDRTILVKAANLIEKRGGVDRVIASMLKSTKTSGNALVNSAAASSTEKKKSDGFLKKAVATPSSGRPGAGITSMGAGMAPYQFQAQPAVAKESVEIANRDLKTAYPGLTPATKSTSAMKRNSGSIMASAKRQTGKKAKGELVAPTAALTAAPVAPVSKTALASVSLADMEKQAIIGALVKGIPAAWRALRAGRGIFGAARIGRTATRVENLRRRTRALRSGAKHLPGNTAGTGRVLTGAPQAAPEGAGIFGRSMNALRNQFRGGIGGGRNIYRGTVGGKPGQLFVGPSSWMNRVPGMRNVQLARMNRGLAEGAKPFELVRRGNATGGIARRFAESSLRGGAWGGGIGYGASYVPGIGDPSLQNAGVFDRNRLRMAGQGALFGLTVPVGGTKTLRGGIAMAAPGLAIGEMTGFSENRRRLMGDAATQLSEARRLRGGTMSRLEAFQEARNRQRAIDRGATRQQLDRLTESARRYRSGQ